MKKLLAKMKRIAKKCLNGFTKACKWIVNKIKEAAQWCMDNQEVVYVVSGVCTVACSLVKKLRKNAVQKEQDYQRTHIYDYSVGHHWTLRRELSSNEMLEFTRRKMMGEPVGDILQSMRVLA